MCMKVDISLEKMSCKMRRHTYHKKIMQLPLEVVMVVLLMELNQVDTVVFLQQTRSGILYHTLSCKAVYKDQLIHYHSSQHKYILVVQEREVVQEQEQTQVNSEDIAVLSL